MLDFQLNDGPHQLLPLNSSQAEQQRVMQTIQAYWHRCGMAIAYHKQRQALTEPSPAETSEETDATG
jgi:hypothetical protein